MKKVFQALELMIRAHGMVLPVKKRFRKYHNDVPYSVHPMRVVRRCQMYLEEWPSAAKYIPHAETMLIVAALHDVPEDTEHTLEEIERDFGKDVRDGVWWLTNPSKEHPELSRETRKEMDRKHLAEAPDHFKIDKLWDRIDNLYDMIGAPTDFILDVYVPESRLLVPVLSPADPLLGEQLVSACDWLEAVTKGRRPAIVPPDKL